MVKLGRPKGKKAKQLNAIKWYVSRDFSSRQIQKKLRKRGLGLRRKTLLHEIRIIKGVKVTKEERERAIPKKYRKPIVFPLKKIEKIYRITLVIRDVPIHSEPFSRHYYGYHLFAFGLSKEELYRELSSLKRILLSKTCSFVHFDITGHPAYDGIHMESPVLIFVDNTIRLNRSWIFRVEHNGIEIYSDRGNF